MVFFHSNQSQLWNSEVSAAAAGSSVVLTENHQPVQAEYDHQEVLDGEESQHLVKDFAIDHGDDSHHQERTVLDEQGFCGVPHVSAVFGEEAAPLLILTLWLVAHHCVKEGGEETTEENKKKVFHSQ